MEGVVRKQGGHDIVIDNAKTKEQGPSIVQRFPENEDTQGFLEEVPGGPQQNE